MKGIQEDNPVIVVDNYDSFTYNLVNQVRCLISSAIAVVVVQNDAVTVDEVFALHPRALVLSPGPGDERAGGISLACLSEAALRQLPVLGVCLGHQLIGAWSGARIMRARTPVHGKPWEIVHAGAAIFSGVKSPCVVARYHSLVVGPVDLPSCLEVLAWTSEGEIMALRHRTYPWYGLQFHPESFLTQEGDAVVRNFFSTVYVDGVQS